MDERNITLQGSDAAIKGLQEYIAFGDRIRVRLYGEDGISHRYDLILHNGGWHIERPTDE